MKFLWMSFICSLVVGALFGFGAYFLTRGFESAGTGADSSMFSLLSGIGVAATGATAVLAVAKMTLLGRVEVRITSPAGHMFTRILTLFISKRLFYKHFGQTIADNREEVNKALARGDINEADKIARELNIDLCRQILELIVALPASVVGKVWQFAKGEKKGDE
ncbi:hypothetical protein CO657_03540 [Rhizobium acidisoli]|uniref:Uncharacterized protein n=1 Tax=Rhizobium acidisoli TaxID=1538158 RepID=A0AAE5TTQ7_9HYPH|nr:hypothetical protein [Rhizobium acidisoli]KPH10226.1 hypothetical protein AOG23_01515 [Rhizobium acidisoli]QAS77219.1 hypothetical protein CO657_03540 [Rhizobium acidisoli]